MKTFLFLILIVFSLQNIDEDLRLLNSLNLNELNIDSNLRNLKETIHSLATKAILKEIKALISSNLTFIINKTDDFSDYPMEKSFSFYDSRSIINFIYDIYEDKFEKVKKVYKSILKANKDDNEINELFDNFFNSIHSINKKEWNRFSFLYKTKEDKNYVRYASMLVYRDIDDKLGKENFAFFLYASSGTFKFDGKMKVEINYSNFGKVNNKTNEIVMIKDKKMKEEDFQQIVKFYNILSIRHMASYFGIKINFPDLNIIDVNKPKPEPEPEEEETEIDPEW